MARIWFAHPEKDSYSSTCCCDELKSLKRKHAVVAQLVEHHLAKVDVASSSLVNRSAQAPRFASGLFRCLQKFYVSRSYYPSEVRVSGKSLVIFFRSDCFGELAAREAGREEKSSKKYRGAKRAGERLKPLSESSWSCFEG